MDTIKLPDSELRVYITSIEKIKKINDGNPEKIKYCEILLKYIDEFKNSGKSSHPEIKEFLNAIIESMKTVPSEIAGEITKAAKASCNNCFFHNEYCINNILFVIFKSVEMKKFIGFKDVRPPLRLLI
jgi:hypothetical protein